MRATKVWSRVHFWQAQALEEVNQRLHDAQWLDEVETMVDDPTTCEDLIQTLTQRLHQQRELHRTQVEESFPKALAERASRSEAQQLAVECERDVVTLGLTLIKDGDNDELVELVKWVQKMLAKLHRLREVLGDK